jgi:hypothetical protein
MPYQVALLRLRQKQIFLCWGFRRTGKAMGQAYQCWWRICRDINDFTRLEYHIFYILYPFVVYLLTVPRIMPYDEIIIYITDTEVQNYWVFELCPLSGILKSREQNVSENGSVSVRRETRTLSGPLERANLNHWTEYRTMDEFQKPGNSECYAPSSEPF